MLDSVDGSSPRAWGTQLTQPGEHGLPGLIPTGVGNTLFPNRSMMTRWAHPHGRGEHRVGTKRSGVMVGLIPTGVGNTNTAGLTAKKHRAHPHGRGEHVVLPGAPLGGLGSSPRVWGAPNKYTAKISGKGLIPTGVGSTIVVIKRVIPWGAHPHGCGEHLEEWARNRGVRGLIPTGVGST